MYLGRISEIKMVRSWFSMPHLASEQPEPLVIAAQSIANIVKSSLGPMGLDKMLVDNIGVSNSERRTKNVYIMKFTGSNYIQRRSYHTFSPCRRAPCRTHFRRTRPEARQGSWRWNDLSRDRRSRTFTSGKRTRQSQNPPNDYHHWVPASV